MKNLRALNDISPKYMKRGAVWRFIEHIVQTKPGWFLVNQDELETMASIIKQEVRKDLIRQNKIQNNATINK